MFSYKRSEYAERLIHLKGRPFSLKDYPFLRKPYDIKASEVLLKAGRQVAKSTTICNIMLTEMASIPYFQSFYVSPSILQTRRFSNQRFDPTIMGSPIIKRHFISRDTIRNVFEKSISNGSCVNFTHAYMEADSLRGISADRVTIDEVQDILWDAVPVIKETMAGSPYQWVMYAGTPKTFDNTIEKLWANSTKCVWLMICPACRHENIPGMDNIGPSCLICSKCAKPLGVSAGEWVSLNPAAERIGFHVPQIIRPNLNWANLHQKLKEYPEGKIYNEILGEPFDKGAKPITEQELIDCSYNYTPASGKTPEYGVSQVFAGIDWACETGYSVVTIGGFDSEARFKVLFAKKYCQVDPRIVIDEVVRFCAVFNIEFIGADRGAGHTNNLLLSSKLISTKMVEFTYAATLREGIRWNKPGKCMIVDRTLAVDSTIHKLKKKQVVFPSYDSFGVTFFPDILCVFTEYNDYLKKIEYKHSKDTPDDFLHSLTYALLVQSISMTKNLPDVLKPV